MILYQRIQVSTGAHVGTPGELPEHLVGLEDATLANLPAALGPETLNELGLGDAGFLPVVVPDPPGLPPPRREIPKSTVISRVNTVGKLATVWAILQANPLAYCQWFTPDWPNVYFDDPGMLAVLNAAALTADEIAQVTA